MKRIARLGAALALAAGIAMSGANGASAAPGAQAATVVRANCYGYEGQFLNYTPLRVNLAGGWRECFGIGLNRGIWHAWPNSGGWREMPHGGRADRVEFAYFNNADQRSIMVWVGGRGNYCTSLNPSKGGWQPWDNC